MQSHRPTDALQCIGAPALRPSRCFNSCLRRAGSNPSRAASTAERCGGGSCCCGLSAVGSIAASLADCPLRAHSLVAGSGCRLAPPVGTLAAACWLEEPPARRRRVRRQRGRRSPEPGARPAVVTLRPACCQTEAPRRHPASLVPPGRRQQQGVRAVVQCLQQWMEKTCLQEGPCPNPATRRPAAANRPAPYTPGPAPPPGAWRG